MFYLLKDSAILLNEDLHITFYNVIAIT